MVKDVYDKAIPFAPVALVLAGWGCFIGGLIVKNAIVKSILMAAARVLP